MNEDEKSWLLHFLGDVYTADPGCLNLALMLLWVLSAVSCWFFENCSVTVNQYPLHDAHP